MRPEPDHGTEHRLRGYIRYLERGATTHASYAQTAGEQALELTKRLDTMAGEMQVAAEDGETVDASPIELVAARIESFNLQASVHTLGLSVCLVGLSILAGMGHAVPDAPPLPEEA